MLELRGRREAPQNAPAVLPRPSEDEPPDRVLACAVCLHALTHTGARTTRDGVHEHTFANPYGCVFRVGCFTSAAGCRGTGEPVLAHSWFPGFAWTIQECGRCAEHVGWSFAGAAGAAFFALILDRLVEVERDG